jgi:rod shape determining protein RodA
MAVGMPFARKLISFNWLLLILTLALCGVGLAFIYAATYMRDGVWADLARSTDKQKLWFYLGLVAMMGGSLVDYRWARYLAWPGYFVALGMLTFLALNLHVGPIKSLTINNATSWIGVGGFIFQPAQLAILSGILLMTDMQSRLQHRNTFIRIIACGAIAAPPMFLIMQQPDLGSTCVWLPVFGTLTFLGGIQKRYLVLAGLLALITLPVIYFKLDGYRKARITSFMHPEQDILGTGYHAWHSLVAIGSAGWEGKGYLTKDSVNVNSMPPPVAPSDFIFSVIGEEMGFRGSIVIVSMLCLLLLTILFIGGQSRDLYGYLLCCGFAAQLFTHCFINLGMTITLVPITGLPLPLISYGGSFLLLTMFALGLIQSVWIHRKVGQGLTQPIGQEIPEFTGRGSFVPEPEHTVSPSAA